MEEQDDFPVVIDTFFLKTSIREATRMMTANYTILYIGEMKDTLVANHFLKTYVPPPPPPPVSSSKEKKVIDTSVYEFKGTRVENPLDGYYLDWMEGRDYLFWDSSQIEVLIDTNTLIKDLNYDYSPNAICAKAYPVLLKNQELDTIYIGYGKYIPLILEAKNKKQAWQAIETRHIYYCGVGVGRIILPPNEIVLTSCPIYKGDFETLLRLKIGNNYSKPFRGNINYSQFQKENY